MDQPQTNSNPNDKYELTKDEKELLEKTKHQYAWFFEKFKLKDAAAAQIIAMKRHQKNLECCICGIPLGIKGVQTRVLDKNVPKKHRQLVCDHCYKER